MKRGLARKTSGVYPALVLSVVAPKVKGLMGLNLVSC